MSMRARLGRLPTLLAVLTALCVLSAPTLEPTVAAAAGLRTILNEIEEEVMCPVCGTLLALAESPQATREKAFVEKLAKEGKNKDEIKEALVNQYGDAVLALPKSSGFSLSAYVVPIVAFVVAVILLAVAIWKWRKAAGRRDDRRPDIEGPSDEDRERLDEDLARYDL
ncbi:MAG TPA: cytochrome c-type biogenesis protein CcmH [Solirubrobacterales bacterium]|jgi:cytochrome c-type biogenesis protein CcmH|nr:cytochrome c-type biogenesis protein CcmH [Solirubrobacterales bacterium]